MGEHAMTYAADKEAAEHYEHHSDDLEDEDITNQVTCADPLSITFSIRFSWDEANAIRDAAQKADQDVFDFVRHACRTAVANEATLVDLRQRLERVEQAVFDS